MTTIHQPALRRRRRQGLAGDEECDSGKSDGNVEKGGGRASATATATATAKRRAMAAATREAGDEEGGEGGKSDGDGNKEGDGDDEGEGEGGESDGDGKEDGEGGKGDGDGKKEGEGEEEGEEEGEGIICNSVFGAPKIICVELTQKKRSHIYNKGRQANSYNAHFFFPFYFFIADSSFFLFAFFLGPYSERNFF